MKTEFKIIETPDYILAVSDEEVSGQLGYDPDENRVKFISSHPKYEESGKKIIAYQPKGNSPKLDLPLLPPFKKEIVGYRLKPNIDRFMVDGILKTAMPIWNDEDKSVYFIKGHVAGSLVAKMKELQVLDLWFTPIYEEVKSNWVKKYHLEYYYKEGIMSDKMVDEDDVEKLACNIYNLSYEEYLHIREQVSQTRELVEAEYEHLGLEIPNKYFDVLSFIAGYNYKSATKVYDEEDLRGAFISGKHGGKTETYMEFEEFIQSFKQPKTPVRFVAEITGGGEYLAGVVGGNEIWAEYPTKLKTTTNSEGKQVLVGTYLYE